MTRHVDAEELVNFPRDPDEKRATRLAAIGRSRRLHAELLAVRGGVPFSPSSELIREAREEREHELP